MLLQSSGISLVQSDYGDGPCILFLFILLQLSLLSCNQQCEINFQKSFGTELSIEILKVCI